MQYEQGLPNPTSWARCSGDEVDESPPDIEEAASDDETEHDRYDEESGPDDSPNTEGR